MQLEKLFALGIEMGKKADPRGMEAVESSLAKNRKKYENADEEEKEFFDTQCLTNPYADSRILNGDPDTEIRKILVGIDMEAPELLLCDRLNEKGAGIDMVLAHHPEGSPYAALAAVMDLQCGHMSRFGVLPNVAEAVMGERIGEVGRSVAASNHQRARDCARLLGIPFACFHTPADNLVTDFLYKLFEQEKPQTVGEAVKLLKTIPEYGQSAVNNAPPRILAGKEDSTLGKIYVDFTGGTSGSEKNYARLSAAGISTVLAMHMSEKHLEAAKKEYMNVILAGHISSDSLGMNLFLDALEKEGIEIVPASGLIRVSRVNNA